MPLLHFEDFFFLYRAEVFDLLGFRVRELFEFFHRPLALVLADLFFFSSFSTASLMSRRMLRTAVR